MFMSIIVIRWWAARLDLGRHQAIDEQELGVSRHCRAATSQNGEATLVVPVVDDVLEHIGLGAGRHGVEEIALDHVASAATPAASRRR